MHHPMNGTGKVIESKANSTALKWLFLAVSIVFFLIELNVAKPKIPIIAITKDTIQKAKLSLAAGTAIFISS